MQAKGCKIAGVDDAGRGAVLGPLVIAGVCISNDKLGQLGEIGVRDSKLLSPHRRAKLYCQIIDIANDVSLIKLTPEQIDEYVLKGKKYEKLNYLEAVSMAKVIESLEAEVVYVDASDVDVERFKQDILKSLKRTVELVSVHHADRIHPIVSAASIIAKVNRDRDLSELADKYGSIGSGYPSDPRTIYFLEGWLREHGDLPPFARRSWKTVKKLLKRKMD
ncbi:MAG: ribonuclease HII [Candidatus Methylarchaceae archaeon HK01M]|nr:ribonuclease HII [Candidatus Methylarchaceae archaeon HK01M]